MAPSGCCDVSLFPKFGLSAVTRCEHGRPFSLGSFRSAVKEGAFPISVDNKNVCESSRTLIISKVQYIMCHNKITTMNGHERRLYKGKLNGDADVDVCGVIKNEKIRNEHVRGSVKEGHKQRKG